MIVIFCCFVRARCVYNIWSYEVDWAMTKNVRDNETQHRKKGRTPEKNKMKMEWITMLANTKNMTN